jgi:hypothetical protein
MGFNWITVQSATQEQDGGWVASGRPANGGQFFFVWHLGLLAIVRPPVARAFFRSSPLKST